MSWITSPWLGHGLAPPDCLRQRQERLLSHHMRQEPIAALGRSLGLLEAILADREGRSVPAIAEGLGLPGPRRTGRCRPGRQERFWCGCRAAGSGREPRLLALLSLVDEKRGDCRRRRAAAPPAGRTAWLHSAAGHSGERDGDLPDQDRHAQAMSSPGGHAAGGLLRHRRVLWRTSRRPNARRHLSTGPFPALTARTITDPGDLRGELAWCASRASRATTRKLPRLICVAVPVYSPGGAALAAISATRSTTQAARLPDDLVLAALRQAAGETPTRRRSRRSGLMPI